MQLQKLLLNVAAEILVFEIIEKNILRNCLTYETNKRTNSTVPNKYWKVLTFLTRHFWS